LLGGHLPSFVFLINFFFFAKSTKGVIKTQQRRRNKGGSELATEKGWGLGKAGDGGRIIILSSSLSPLIYSPSFFCYFFVLSV